MMIENRGLKNGKQLQALVEKRTDRRSEGWWRDSWRLAGNCPQIQNCPVHRLPIAHNQTHRLPIANNQTSRLPIANFPQQPPQTNHWPPFLLQTCLQSSKSDLSDLHSIYGRGKNNQETWFQGFFPSRPGKTEQYQQILVREDLQSTDHTMKGIIWS